MLYEVNKMNLIVTFSYSVHVSYRPIQINVSVKNIFEVFIAPLKFHLYYQPLFEGFSLLLLCTVCASKL